MGKTTVAAALALAAAGRGKRALLVEVAAQRRAARLFGVEAPPGKSVALHPNLEALSIDPQIALEEYLRSQVKVRAVAKALFENRVFTYFAAATPGLRELVTLGKVRALCEEPHHELVVVDAAATGHGVAFLKVPRTFMDVARMGPVRQRAEWVAEWVEDATATAVLLVTTPEELPVSETLEAAEEVVRCDVALAGVIANAVYPPLFLDEDGAELERVAQGSPPLATAAAGAAASRLARTADQREQLDRLPQTLAQLPFLFEERIDARALGRLAEELTGL